MKEILKDIIEYLSPYKKKILFVVICVAAFGLILLLPPSPLRAVLCLLIVFVFVAEGYKWIGQPELWGTKIGKTMRNRLVKNKSEDLDNEIQDVTVIKVFTNEEEDLILEEIENNPEILEELETIQYKATVDFKKDIEHQILPEGNDRYNYEYHIIYDGTNFYHVSSYEMSGLYEKN